MSISPVSNLLSSLNLQVNTQTGTTAPTTQATASDSLQLHPIASLFSKLDQLAKDNPQVFQTFLAQAQSEVTAAAKTETDPQTKTFLHALAGVFQRGQQDPGQPLAFLHHGTFNASEHPAAENLLQSLNADVTKALAIKSL